MLKSLIHRVLPRSYITARHGSVSRWVLGAGAYGAALVTTMDHTLAREVWRRMWADDYPSGLARLAWYARRRFPGLDMSVDPLSLFCSGMTPPELQAMRRFLLRHGRVEDEALLGELCFISASAAIETFGTPGYVENISRLRADAGALLDRSLSRMADAADPSAQPLAESRRAPTAISSRAGFSPLGAETALRDTLALLETGGFRPFILSGTLLGAIREGRMLEHDYDIDLGLFADETDLTRLERLLHHSPPFRCIRHECQTLILDAPAGLRRRDMPAVYKLRHASGIMVDIFLHYREDDVIWHGTALYRWENSPFTLSPCDLAGINPLAPANAEQNLTENYGDWREPKYSFHCALDTPNLALFAGPMALAVAIRRFSMLLSRPADAARLLDQMAAAGFIESDPEKGWKISEAVFRPSGGQGRGG
ncbi:hypothetical protein LO749_23800 (plasmid) [Paracoccus denitrificans]|uniref:hypothetical protein n=1 Tax=Paracoccus denitrificans TaxID=266 RepID=UPI001E5FB697|nr:hypothetical protein [Paracoccus denitrificans]UFS68010.1 hypothetical protein LO749_23800 [Paracoccus denitrificans]